MAETLLRSAWKSNSVPRPQKTRIGTPFELDFIFRKPMATVVDQSVSFRAANHSPEVFHPSPLLNTFITAMTWIRQLIFFLLNPGLIVQWNFASSQQLNKSNHFTTLLILSTKLRHSHQKISPANLTIAIHSCALVLSWTIFTFALWWYCTNLRNPDILYCHSFRSGFGPLPVYLHILAGNHRHQKTNITVGATCRFTSGWWYRTESDAAPASACSINILEENISITDYCRTARSKHWIIRSFWSSPCSWLSGMVGKQSAGMSTSIAASFTDNENTSGSGGDNKKRNKLGYHRTAVACG